MGRALVQAQGLVKRFGDCTAVDGIDVEVRPGEVFGPNGAGNFSTMRMVGCVFPPSGGELRILDMDPVTDGPAIRARVGVCPQLDNLDSELTNRVLLYVPDGDAAVAEVSALGLQPGNVLVRRSGLEDIFLHLTGRTLVD